MKLIVKNNEKLIKFLIHNIQGLSFANAQKLLRKGDVKVNSKRTKENIEVVTGDEIDVYSVQKAMPKVNIMYEDNNVLIVHKPYGIECATRDKSSENTYSLEEIFAEKNAKIVHRLDRLTEGLVILAKTLEVVKKFERYFSTGKVKKFYKALVYSIPNTDGIKTAYLKKDSLKSEVLISDTKKDGYKEIITEFQIENKYNNSALLDINLHTGRTHQIRAYFSHIGCPVINDAKYGNGKNISNSKYKGYFLTAYKINFEIDDDLKYLNELNIEISPTWLTELTQEKDILEN